MGCNQRCNNFSAKVFATIIKEKWEFATKSFSDKLSLTKNCKKVLSTVKNSKITENQKGNVVLVIA